MKTVSLVEWRGLTGAEIARTSREWWVEAGVGAGLAARPQIIHMTLRADRVGLAAKFF